jgi:hypothetical protein
MLLRTDSKQNTITATKTNSRSKPNQEMKNINNENIKH